MENCSSGSDIREGRHCRRDTQNLDLPETSQVWISDLVALVTDVGLDERQKREH